MNKKMDFAPTKFLGTNQIHMKKSVKYYGIYTDDNLKSFKIILFFFKII